MVEADLALVADELQRERDPARPTLGLATP
jgi:hypothetical protein